MPLQKVAQSILTYLDDPSMSWISSSELADLLVDAGVATTEQLVRDAVALNMTLGLMIRREDVLGVEEVAAVAGLSRRDADLVSVTSQLMPLRTWM